MLVNTNGSAKGVGVGLSYILTTGGTDYDFDLDLTAPVTLIPRYLNYDSSSNSSLNLSAHLGVTDKSVLSGGTVNIPAVITLTHP